MGCSGLIWKLANVESQYGVWTLQLERVVHELKSIQECLFLEQKPAKSC